MPLRSRSSRAGAHIIAVARTVGGLEELDDAIKAEGGTATLVPLDMTDLDGIARLGAALNERHGKLDVLVGNAAVLGPVSPLGHIDMKSWTDTMTVNVNANFQLVRCMEPLLKQSDAPRAVFVSSGAAARPPPMPAPTPPRRQRSRRSRASGPTRPPTCRCASTCSIRDRSAPACARS